MREGHFDIAEQLLEVLSKQGDKNKIEVYVYRGVLYRCQNRLQSALRQFERVLALLTPAVKQEIQNDLYENIGFLYYDLNDYKKAGLYLRKYKELGGEIEEANIEFLAYNSPKQPRSWLKPYKTITFSRLFLQVL